MRAEFRTSTRRKRKSRGPPTPARNPQPNHKAACGDPYPEAEHLKSVNQKRFDRARNHLTIGSIIAAERDYRDLITDLESQGHLAEKSCFFARTQPRSSLWQQFRVMRRCPGLKKLRL